MKISGIDYISLSRNQSRTNVHLQNTKPKAMLTKENALDAPYFHRSLPIHFHHSLWKAYSPTSPLLIQHQRFVSKCATRSSSATPSANVFTSSTPSTPVKHMVNEATPSRKRPFSSAMPVIDTRVYLLCPAGRTLGIRARRARVDDFLLLSASGWATGGGLAGCVILSTLRPTTLVVVVDIAVF